MFSLETTRTAAAPAFGGMRLRTWVRLVHPMAVTAAIISVALLIQLSPLAAVALQYDRQLIGEGQVWRIVTGHWVHWNADHLVWDVLMFAALGAACESRNRRQFLTCVLLSAVAISAALLVGLPQFTTYRGLSGLDSALFTLWVFEQIKDMNEARRGKEAAALGLLLVAFAGKIAFELTMGQTLFVDSTAANFTPVVSAHAIGAAIGAGCALRRRSGEATAKPCTAG